MRQGLYTCEYDMTNVSHVINRIINTSGYQDRPWYYEQGLDNYFSTRHLSIFLLINGFSLIIVPVTKNTTKIEI